MISDSDNKITEETMPIIDEWASLYSKIPTEVVALDEKRQYNQEKSPDFHDWLING
ncbi:AbrB family transcriptional regulator [Leuconostoc sp. MS02]|uniref:AbrB family transcriptional regulator n=1 Tax=Leuconostoc aquikimchii TaxID=3236804 RepID=A0ABV3S6I3_9LACO